jgi:hypothetical protein
VLRISILCDLGLTIEVDDMKAPLDLANIGQQAIRLTQRALILQAQQRPFLFHYLILLCPFSSAFSQRLKPFPIYSVS